jgi:superfamily II DNA or RNA helicase
MITLEFDANYCQIKGLSPQNSEVKNRIITNLTYEDSSISYSNKMSNFYRDPNICLLDKTTSKFYTGLLARVAWILDNCKEKYQVIKLIPTVQASLNVDYPSWLYPHQIEIIKRCLEVKRGVVESPTGSGKSLSIAWLLKHFPTSKILITVPEKSLLKQLKSTIAQTLEIDDSEIGEVTASKKVFKRVTIGIINSLAKLAKESSNIFKDTEVLICDEAHRVGANFYRDLCLVCPNTDYRLGFSATAWRGAGDDKVMEGLLGPLTYKIKEQDLIDKGLLTRPVYIEVRYKSPLYTYSKYNSVRGNYNTKNGKPDRAEVYSKCIVRNPSRNNLIINMAEAYLNSGSQFPGLILVQNIEHGEILQDLFKLKLGLELPFVYGKSSLETRRSLVTGLLDGSVKLAIASSVFNEGQNIPNLGLGIIAGGGSSESRIIQQIGRFIRKYDSKDKGVIIDINDDEAYYLQYNFYTRKSKVVSTYPKAHVVLDDKKVIELSKSAFKYL